MEGILNVKANHPRALGGKARQDFEGLIAAFQWVAEGVEVPQVYNQSVTPVLLGYQESSRGIFPASRRLDGASHKVVRFERFPTTGLFWPELRLAEVKGSWWKAMFPLNEDAFLDPSENF